MTTLENEKAQGVQQVVGRIVCNNAELHWLTHDEDAVCYIYGRHEEPAMFLWWDKERQHYGFEMNMPYARALDGYENYVRDGWQPYSPNDQAHPQPGAAVVERKEKHE